MKKVNKFNKLLSFILSITIILGLLPTTIVIADNEVENAIAHKHDVESYVNEEVKPKIDINYLGTIPTTPMEGQDFKVRYQIVPHPFQHNLSKPKELVMVLDISGSMNYCSTHNERVGHKVGNTNTKCTEASKISNLKTAAKNFINTMSATLDDKVTPKISNLKIGIITYSTNGSKAYDLVELTNESGVNSKNVNKLIEEIEALRAEGGTNTGDGLRKGANMLNESKTDANKAIIFMGDGEPTYYTYEVVSGESYWECNCTGTGFWGCGRNKCTSGNPCRYSHWWNNNCRQVIENINKYYTTLDYADKYVGGSGSGDDDGRSLGYATIIGNIIKDKQYNVFTIGYGLGNEDSYANIKMKRIHESMGGISSGEKSTFFATDAGAIDSVFSKIADALEKSYSFSDAQLDLNLSQNIQVVDGFSTSDNNGNIIKINPIVYELGKGNWYTAETQTIEFTIKANKSGEFNIFQDENNLIYTDIYGNTQEVPIENSTIVIKPFEATEAQKLSVDLRGDAPGYLIGDTIRTTVTMTHPGIAGITYSEAKFNLRSIPNNFKVLNGINSELNFGNVSETISKEYDFTIEDDSEVTTTKEKKYNLSGDYSYKLRKNNATTSIKGDKSLDINVKRGQINVKVLDEEGNDITELSSIVIKDRTSNEMIGNFSNGNIVFDSISSGNHELVIKSLPDGCTPTENGGNAKVAVNYANNVVNYTFKVNGTATSSEIKIDANLIGYSPSYPYVGDEITVTYEIDPHEFKKEDIGSIALENAKLVFDLGDDFTAIEGKGLTADENGEYILDFTEKINYTYDSESSKYTADKITVSFVVKANNNGEGITFNRSEIQYTNILSNSKENITKEIQSPSIFVRAIVPVPDYNGPDIRILEIEPADSFKLTKNSSGKVTTGVEKDIKITSNNSEYNIEVVHITMPEFIGKVDDLNGKYDVIVIGNYVQDGINDKYSFYNSSNSNTKRYEKDDGYEYINNDITKRKANEITEFIDSGQLVFVDNSIKSTNAQKLNQYANNNWNKNTNNLVNDMSFSTSNDKLINLQVIVDKYISMIETDSSIIKPKLTVSNPEHDSNEDILGSIYKRNMRFNLKVDDLSEEDVTINLYLDINGDGLFKDEEIMKTVQNVKIPSNGYVLEYDFYKDNPLFIGYLDWRIEIVKNNTNEYSNSIKSYYDNNVLFRRISEDKREINVLQVSPYDRTNLNSSSGNKKTNLIQNDKFMKLLSDLKDYDIKVDVISYQDFYQNNFLGPGKTNLKESKYNIVILGFSDMYKSKSLSDYAMKQLTEFIQSGQGLMLTHDTLLDKSNGLFKSFRDIAGQSRYFDGNNPDEWDIDGVSKIVHDEDVPNNDKMGESLWQTYDYGGSNGNSTKVYKVNESLLTTYPYELGEYITIRSTHGQYYELNLEDEDVVTNFTLTDYNTKQDNTKYGSAKADKYDVRNNYYTYSRGNITFSGTGEDGREDSYPEQELKLFVNTIVKAERGANHKPEISALENITEVPFNSNLDFNAIIKDIDGDKIRINRITVDGAAIEGYKSATEFFNQGSKFPVTITKNYLDSKVGKEVKVIIEAEDVKGAISVKEYTIIPVTDALLTSNGETINTLVGEKVNFDIKLNRENDTTLSSIIVNSVDIPTKEGIVTLSDINTKVVNGEIYLSGSLTSIVEVTGEEIPITINYTNGTSTMKKCEVKIILNSKYANVNVALKGNTGNLGITPKVTLLNKTNNKSYISNISSVDGQVAFSTIGAGEYEMFLTDLVGYDIESININGNKTNLSSDGKISFNINFNESSKLIEIIVRPQISDLYHGLYGGIEEISGNSSIVRILENPNGFEMIAGNKVTFGAKFTVGGSNFKFNLNVDGKLDDVLLSNIKVYKTVNNNGDIDLEELTNLNGNTVRTTEVSGKNFEISIGNVGNIGSTTETEIVVIYTGVIKNNSKNDNFTNTIKFIDNKAKDVMIYTTNNGQDQIKELPDLF